MKSNDGSIVVISPHPDDDVIGMGGTIVKYLSGGYRVCSVYVTNGIGGTRTLDISDEELARTRRREARRSGIRVLGMTRIYFLSLASQTQVETDTTVRFEYDENGRLKLVFYPDQPEYGEMVRCCTTIWYQLFLQKAYHLCHFWITYRDVVWGWISVV